MKKIFFIIFILILLIFSNVKVVTAQTDFPKVENVFNNMGSCGKINQACCDLDAFQIPKVSPDNLPSLDLPSPLDILTTPFKEFEAWIINSMNDPLSKGIDAIKNFVYNITGVTDKLICGENLTPTDKKNPNSCLCIDKKLENISRLCLMVSPEEQPSCLSCVTYKKGIWTALGCIESDISQFVRKFILNWGIGLGGGFSLLCIIYAAFMMQSSQGNPEKLKKSQETITSCIMGLMLIIFSVFILKLIGVNILKIPGFGG